MQTCEIDNTSASVTFHLAARVRTERLDSVVDSVMELVRSMPCRCDGLEDVELALREALANAIFHGNHEDPAKQVHICGACGCSGDLMLIVEDEGEGFDERTVPDPTTSAGLLSPHGRGLFLIRQLMGRVEHELGGRRIVMHTRGG